MATDFKIAAHTVIVSDIHLTDAEPPHPHNPLWKKFKRLEFFIDDTFQEFLIHIQKTISSPIELVLNGDIFDFDSVMVMPTDHYMHVNWLERIRGLDPEEEKSKFKIKTIFDDHPVWVHALKDFLSEDNRVIFVIGNHDIELHWVSVQKIIIDRLRLSTNHEEKIRFAEWFYISNEDTLIEHGNQYDAYGLCTNPINPVIKKHKKYLLRLPFGNLAGKYMLNGMGLMNPQSEASFIKDSLWDYLKFFYKYVLRIQPLMLWSWFWSALVSLLVTVTEGLKPAVTDPLTISDRIEHIAKKSNANVKMVLSMRELHAHPAALNPIQVLQELWLDRAILFVLVVYISFQISLFYNMFARFSIWLFIIPFALLLPVFIFYSRSISSGIQKALAEAFEKIPTAAAITKVKRTVHGHTHIAKHCDVSGVEYLNTGTWSASYEDVECTKPFGIKCFAWIRPDGSGARIAELFEWTNKGSRLIAKEGLPVSFLHSSHFHPKGAE